MCSPMSVKYGAIEMAAVIIIISSSTAVSRTGLAWWQEVSRLVTLRRAKVQTALFWLT